MADADELIPSDSRWTNFGGKTVVFSAFGVGTESVVVAEYVKGKRTGARLIVKTVFSDSENGVRAWLERKAGGDAEEGLAASGSLAHTQARPEGRNDVQDTSSEVNIGIPWENGKTSHQTRDLDSSCPEVVYSDMPIPPLGQKYSQDGNLNLRRIETTGDGAQVGLAHLHHHAGLVAEQVIFDGLAQNLVHQVQAGGDAYKVAGFSRQQVCEFQAQALLALCHLHRGEPAGAPQHAIREDEGRKHRPVHVIYFTFAAHILAQPKIMFL